jgi:high-affinity nickel permease
MLKVTVWLLTLGICMTCDMTVSYCARCLSLEHSGLKSLHQLMIMTADRGLLPMPHRERVTIESTCNICGTHESELFAILHGVFGTVLFLRLASQDVVIRYCATHGHQSNEIQRLGFFPSYYDQSVFSWELLQLFRDLNLRSGLSQQAFIQAMSGISS